MGHLIQGQAYQRIFKRTSGYVYGSYLVTPREKTRVASPIPGVPLSVPDVYSLRFGAAYALQPSRGLYLILGGRFDGIPVRDILGGNDGFRRPGYSLYLEPGISVNRGRGSYTLSFPVRVHQNFKPSLVDVQKGRLGGGDLARFLILAQYSLRF